ncbi:hypothetical protein TNCV_4383971 [Trichonephila clavipes]|nr:hypothetical protein TNCV_4383971 [Trichonephila clavipes]
MAILVRVKNIRQRIPSELLLLQRKVLYFPVPKILLSSLVRCWLWVNRGKDQPDTTGYPIGCFLNNSIEKLKSPFLYERGRRRRRRLFPEGWEKKINHDVRMDLIKKTPTTKRGGRTYPKARTLYRSRAPAGREEERRKESGTAEGSESRR